MGSALDYDDHRIDETAQIILRVLRDMGRRATAGELRREAGLDETNPVHYRVERHLGPAGLVTRAGRRERPGGAQDEVIYELTDDGAAFVDTYESDLTNAVAASEAVETLRRIRATVESYDDRLSTLERMIQNWRQWKNRWGTRVGRIEDNVTEELEEDRERRANRRYANARQRGEIIDRVEEVENRLDGIESRMDDCEKQLGDLEEAIADRPTTEQVDESLAVLSQEVAAEIDAVREDAKGLF